MVTFVAQSSSWRYGLVRVLSLRSLGISFRLSTSFSESSSSLPILRNIPLPVPSAIQTEPKSTPERITTQSHSAHSRSPHGKPAARYSFWLSDAAEEPWLRCRGDHHAGAWHWSKHLHFQHGGLDSPAALASQRSSAGHRTRIPTAPRQHAEPVFGC